MTKLNKKYSDKEFDELLLKTCLNYPMPEGSRVDSVMAKVFDGVNTARHTSRRLIKYAVAAACIVIAAITVSPVGRVAAGKLYNHIFPDKNNAVVTLEGSSEKVNYSGEVIEYPADSGLADYGIHIDKSMYQMKSNKHVLTITPVDYTEKDMKDTPVYMTIVQTSSDRASSLAAELDKIKSESPAVCNVEKSDLMGDSDKIYAQWFSVYDYQWDGDVESVYIADNGKGGSFIITIHYFADCEEGHAARLTDMANSITVFED